MFGEPWLNVGKYGLVPLLIFATGASMWVIVYIIYIRNCFKYKFMEMPLIAACANFTWEFVWSIFFSTDQGKLLEYGYKAWLFIDIFLLYFVIKYAHKHIFVDALKPYARQIAVLFLAFFGLAWYYFADAGLDTPTGANSAYIAQVLLSVLYINLIVHKKSVADLSYAVAWLRMLGSGLTSTFMAITYIQGTNAANMFVAACCVFALALDLIYIKIFIGYRRAEASETAYQV